MPVVGPPDGVLQGLVRQPSAAAASGSQVSGQWPSGLTGYRDFGSKNDYESMVRIVDKNGRQYCVFRRIDADQEFDVLMSIKDDPQDSSVTTRISKQVGDAWKEEKKRLAAKKNLAGIKQGATSTEKRLQDIIQSATAALGTNQGTLTHADAMEQQLAASSEAEPAGGSNGIAGSSGSISNKDLAELTNAREARASGPLLKHAKPTPSTGSKVCTLADVHAKEKKRKAEEKKQKADAQKPAAYKSKEEKDNAFQERMNRDAEKADSGDPDYTDSTLRRTTSKDRAARAAPTAARRASQTSGAPMEGDDSDYKSDSGSDASLPDQLSVSTRHQSRPQFKKRFCRVRFSDAAALWNAHPKKMEREVKRLARKYKRRFGNYTRFLDSGLPKGFGYKTKHMGSQGFYAFAKYLIGPNDWND